MKKNLKKEMVLNNSKKEAEVFLEFKMNSIILLIGPSGCGKTYSTENKLIPGLKSGRDVKVHHVASDDIRRDILGEPELSKMDKKMFNVSKPAFQLLNARVNALTSYPVNAEFIIVDSTGLSQDFRNSIKTIAEANNYNIAVVMFDYKGRAPYYDYLSEEDERKAITSRQIDYMRQEVMRDVSKKNYRNIIKIKTHDLDKYKIEVINYEEQESCNLPLEYDYITIGDIHGCYDEFIALLEKNGFIIDKENKKILGHEDDYVKI